VFPDGNVSHDRQVSFGPVAGICEEDAKCTQFCHWFYIESTSPTLAIFFSDSSVCGGDWSCLGCLLRAHAMLVRVS
jgi:hypothetical protein